MKITSNHTVLIAGYSKAIAVHISAYLLQKKITVKFYAEQFSVLNLCAYPTLISGKITTEQNKLFK